MNCSKFTLIIVLLGITTTFLVGQETVTNYEHSRITLSSGEIIKAKDITLTDSKVSYTEQAVYRQFDLNEIQSIETATKSHWLTGMLVGAGVGIGTTIGVTAAVQAPREADSAPNEIPWWSDGYTYSGTNGEITYDMAFVPQFLSV